MERAVAEVALPVNADRTFDYRVLPLFLKEAEVGKRVRVSFRGKAVEGFLIGLKERSGYEGELQPLLEILDPEPVLDGQRLELARWLSEYYLTPLGIVLKGLVPKQVRVGGRPGRTARYVKLGVSLEAALAQLEGLRGPQQRVLLQTLLRLASAPSEQELLAAAGCTRAVLRSLETKGLLAIEPASGPPARDFHEPPSQVELMGEQQAALSRVIRALETTAAKTFLLHGVNGSGKTEIYMQAAARALALGREAIIVVPEISLTPQLVARFRHRFGEQIAVYHSGLTAAELARQWARMVRGEARLVIGVRAAIFAPFRNLGLIVVDEEHEPTYKQDEPAPRYHLREVARKRAQLSRATVILGTATPTLESYYCAQQGEFELLELRERVVGVGAPEVEIIDMRGERPSTVLSKRLREAIASRLARGEQMILLLNRRGFSTALCRKCGAVIRCPRCQIPLVYHLRAQELLCHYCGYTLRHPRCRRCGSSELLFLGLGTEQVELELERLFPAAVVRRMDSDAVRRGEHGPILEAFRQGKIAILFGTQMIGVGLDFPNVTLVGIVSADTTLDLPGFRAGERAFQLISQAAGRAGRGPKGGEVLIQTYHPEHYAIQAAAAQDYAKFYDQELRFRQELGYPPFTELIQLTVEGADRARAEEQAERWKGLLADGLEVLGPVAGLPARVRGRYQWQLLLKGKDRAALHQAVRAGLEALGREGVKIDVDPGL
ncbi:MAG: primosomal protein N' [Candidatus Acetothermia bacterium]|jgi:primosomal protein N' (replication factor Y)|nr:primosomal protein N' [Candidatus Acetothermia bacterium]MDH7504892.1 primosomal protein N' [Candidatus Acetothermia bacterium]